MFIHSLVIKYININAIGLCKLQSYAGTTHLTILNAPQELLNCNLCLCISKHKDKEKFYPITLDEQNIYAQLDEEYESSCYIALISFNDNTCKIVAHSSNCSDNYLPVFLQNNSSHFLSQIQKACKTESLHNEELNSIEITQNKETLVNDVQEETIIETSTQNEQILSENSFYTQIKPSLDALFNNNPNDEVLENALEHSKFAKIMQDGSENFHSVGIIFSKGYKEKPEYICFALPCLPSSPPPKDMEKFAQLLIIDNNTAYYLMYQNALTGENAVLY